MAKIDANRCQFLAMAGAFVALLLLSGCETTMPNTAWPWKKAEATLVEPVVPKDYDPLELDLGERVEGTEMFAEGEALSALPVSEPLAGQVVLPIREGADPVAPSTAEPYSLADDLTQEVENPNELLEVQLNLDGEDLITVIQMFSYLLGEKMETEEVAPEDGVPLEDAVPEPELTPVPLDEDQFDDGQQCYRIDENYGINGSATKLVARKVAIIEASPLHGLTYIVLVPLLDTGWGQSTVICRRSDPKAHFRCIYQHECCLLHILQRCQAGSSVSLRLEHALLRRLSPASLGLDRRAGLS